MADTSALSLFMFESIKLFSLSPFCLQAISEFLKADCVVVDNIDHLGKNKYHSVYIGFDVLQ